MSIEAAPQPVFKFIQIACAFKHDFPAVVIVALREDGSVFWKRLDELEWTLDPAPLP